MPIFKDGSKGDVVYMSIQQIKNSWNQGYAKGNSGAHKNFTDEMCKKTIITRVCKTLINASDDGDLIDTYAGAEEEINPREEQQEMTASKEFDEEVIDTTAKDVVEDAPSGEPVQQKLEDECPL